MSAPCMCWRSPVRLHDGHCCMFDGTPTIPACHPEAATAARKASAEARVCGCLSWLDRLDGVRCSHDLVTA